MQFLTFLLASASIGFAVAAPKPETSAQPIEFPKGWCNGGTPGSGECEAMGLNTYCCTDQNRDKFVTWRVLRGVSQNDSKGYDCPDNGSVYCA
ncbi:hypothetical protein E4U09_007884 [Claviceps aff. purpurea]|uniref:Uncharacterized protein n=1 Tax=Claviceps aff. purpurea TaxID=1967640 RepID=A0A9P7QBV6_9HYPO|nr:hypothetical protein E4U09_007884 [Claviceps aff. purpurea]